MDGGRVAKLYADLGYPGATKFQSALRKEGINLPVNGIKYLVKTWGHAKSLGHRPNTKAT